MPKNSFDIIYSPIENKILTEYRDGREKVKTEIAGIFEKYGTYPTNYQINKDKLKKIYAAIALILATMQTRVINYIASGLTTMIDEARDAFINNTGLEVSELSSTDRGILLGNNLWNEYIKQYNGKLLVDIKSEIENALSMNTRNEVIDGTIHGNSYTDIIANIKKDFDIAASRAKGLSLYSNHKVYNESMLYMVDKAKVKGVKVQKYWRHNPEPHPRPTHLAADGRAADANGVFHIGGKKTEAPGMFGDPEDDANCHCDMYFRIIEDNTENNFK